MQPLRPGDRVKVIDGTRKLGETGRVIEKSPSMDESGICVRLDRGETDLFRRHQLLRIERAA
jgi:hypothetical protein